MYLRFKSLKQFYNSSFKQKIKYYHNFKALYIALKDCCTMQYCMLE